MMSGYCEDCGETICICLDRAGPIKVQVSKIDFLLSRMPKTPERDGLVKEIVMIEDKTRQLESQLTAEREARQEAHEAFEVVKKQHLLAMQKMIGYKQRAEAAEARIKASQEQEPHHWLLKPSTSNTHVSLARRELSLNGKFNDHWDIEAAYYAQPIIPPEVEELQREIEQRELNAKQLIAGFESAMRENTELNRKLAEQQAVIKYAIEISESALDGKYEDHKADAHLHIINKLKNSYGFELTKLLEEAKRQAVPEGWKLVPIEPTDNMLIALLRNFASTSSNTMLDNYKAMLSAAPQPERKTRLLTSVIRRRV